MKRFFRSIACWFATYRALDRAEALGEPEPIILLLKNYPEARVRVFTQARRSRKTGAVWIALVYGIALAQAEPVGTLNFLKELLTHVPRGELVPEIPWSRLNSSQAQAVAFYLARNATSADLGRFLLKLTFDQLKTIHPGDTDWWHHLWLAAVTAQRMLHETLTEYEMLRAADLLRRSPSSHWVDVLRKTWLNLESRVRDEYTGQTARSAWIDRGPRTQLELAAGAVLSALGACAAAGSSFRSFDEDEKHSHGLSEAIEENHRLVDYYNGLVEQYRIKAVDKKRRLTSVENELLSEIHATKEKLAEVSELITSKKRHEAHYSPGYLLWGVVRQAQRYPTCVRQGAAWGLHFIKSLCPLTEATKTRVVNALRYAAACEDNPDFRERRIQLLPGQSIEELAAALHDGLCWMVDLAEGEYSPTRKRAEPWNVPAEKELQHSLALMTELMPKALQFLTEYPLRLMTLDDHRSVLGKYVRDGCHWMFWTRYHGELHTGTVTARDICLVDRSGPNSMGVYFRLFAHPLLALPVVYHESMHYGGPTGTEELGIASEANVWLRELLFARCLLARLAEPVQNEQLPAFEGTILNVLRQTRMQSLLLHWLCPIEDDEAWRQFNVNIEGTYGKPLTAEQTDERLHLYFLNQKIEVQFANDTEAKFWCPDILWKDLDHPDTAELTRAYVQVLCNRWQCMHTLTPQERDRILAEPGCKAMQAAWEAYTERRHSCETLREARAELNLVPEHSDSLTVRRFDFEPEIVRIQLIVNLRRDLAEIRCYLEELEQMPSVAPVEPEAFAEHNDRIHHHQTEIDRLLRETRKLLDEALQEGRLQRLAMIFGREHDQLVGRLVALLEAGKPNGEDHA